MNPWTETICIILIAMTGAFAGWVLSRGRTPARVAGFALPAGLLLLLLASRFGLFPADTALAELAVSRSRYVLLTIAITLGLTMPLPWLPWRFERVITVLLMLAFVGWFSVLPFLYPALLRERLLTEPTRFDAAGVCRQTQTYTCGPAAAVTALRMLGLPAREGELAVLARSNPVTGTVPMALCQALSRRYAAEGLQCHWRQFESVDQLRGRPPVLAVINDAFWQDHCVTIVEVSDEFVTIADPAMGKHNVTRGYFSRIWKNCGITLIRQAPSNPTRETTEAI